MGDIWGTRFAQLVGRMAFRVLRHAGNNAGPEAAPNPGVSADRLYGAADRGEAALPLRRFGDSLNTGQGAEEPDETLGALTATDLVDHLARPVDMTTFAIGGARSDGLADQVEESLRVSSRVPGVALIMIGGNDVPQPKADWDHYNRSLGMAVSKLTNAGDAVVVGTCADLRVINEYLDVVKDEWVKVPPHGRALLSITSRSYAAAQIATVVANGGVAVAFSRLTSEFLKNRSLISDDGVHPSADGQARMAKHLLPALRLASMRFEPAASRRPVKIHPEIYPPRAYVRPHVHHLRAQTDRHANPAA